MSDTAISPDDIHVMAVCPACGAIVAVCNKKFWDFEISEEYDELERRGFVVKDRALTENKRAAIRPCDCTFAERRRASRG